MYKNDYLRSLRRANTESLVSPLDDDRGDTEAGYTQPTYTEPILPTEDSYEKVLGPARTQNTITLAEVSKDVYNDPDND